MVNKIELEEPVYNAVVNYLATRPYREVAQLLQAIGQSQAQPEALAPVEKPVEELDAEKKE